MDRTKSEPTPKRNKWNDPFYAHAMKKKTGKRVAALVLAPPKPKPPQIARRAKAGRRENLFKRLFTRRYNRAR